MSTWWNSHAGWGSKVEKTYSALLREGKGTNKLAIGSGCWSACVSPRSANAEWFWHVSRSKEVMECKSQTMSGLLQRSRLCCRMRPRPEELDISGPSTEAGLPETRLQPLQGMAVWQKVLPQALESHRGALEGGGHPGFACQWHVLSPCCLRAACRGTHPQASGAGEGVPSTLHTAQAP